jgi:arylsulfatase A-like enzyme
LDEELAVVCKSFADEDPSRVNPYGLLRKICIRDQTWNGILAPPETVLRFPIRVRPGAILEFGFVVLPLQAKKRQEIEFAVYLDMDRGEERVFSMRLGAEETGLGQVHFEKIALNMVDVDNIELVFSTTHRSKERADPNLCAWINPHIYVPKASTKNVILVSLDTVRWDYVGVYSDNAGLTPWINELSKDAVVFDHAYAQSPWTLPSHVSLLTGIYPNVHATNTFSSRIPSDVQILPQLLRKEGYTCFAYTGGGPVSHAFGFSKGFDLYKEGDGLRIPDASTPLYRRAMEFIRTNGKKNFFLMLHTYQFHEPLESPEKIVRRIMDGRTYKWRKRSLRDLAGRSKYRPLNEEEIENIKVLYEAEVTTIDEYLIAPLIRLLKAEGLYDQTMIIITSDHGEEIFDHGGWQHGHSLYNEITKVPLIVKFLSSRYAGTRVTENVRLIDVVPTILDELDIEAPERQFDGKGLVALVEGKENEPRACFSQFTPMKERPQLPGRVSVVWGDHKLILNQAIPDWANFFDFPPPALPAEELYDLREDPLEKRNIYTPGDDTAMLLLAMAKDYLRKERRSGELSILDDQMRDKLSAVGYLE